MLWWIEIQEWGSEMFHVKQWV